MCLCMHACSLCVLVHVEASVQVSFWDRVIGIHWLASKAQGSTCLHVSELTLRLHTAALDFYFFTFYVGIGD